MRHLRLLIIALATICVLALAAFALVTTPQMDPGDDIIIKGGSIELQCGKNHTKDCFGVPDLTTGKYKKIGNDNKHILRIVVRDNVGGQLSNNNFDAYHQPSVTITYK